MSRFAFETLFGVVGVKLLTTRNHFLDTSSIDECFFVEERGSAGGAVVGRCCLGAGIAGEKALDALEPTGTETVAGRAFFAGDSCAISSLDPTVPAVGNATFNTDSSLIV